jgi:hypothetical protein
MVWIKVVMAYFKVLSWNFPGETKGNHENPKLESQLSNGVPPEYTNLLSLALHIVFWILKYALINVVISSFYASSEYNFVAEW